MRGREDKQRKASTDCERPEAPRSRGTSEERAVTGALRDLPRLGWTRQGNEVLSDGSPNFTRSRHLSLISTREARTPRGLGAGHPRGTHQGLSRHRGPSGGTTRMHVCSSSRQAATPRVAARSRLRGRVRDARPGPPSRPASRATPAAGPARDRARQRSPSSDAAARRATAQRAKAASSRNSATPRVCLVGAIPGGVNGYTLSGMEAQ